MHIASKWPKIVMMESTTAEATTKQLHQVFSTHGLPLQIISDNGTQFVAKTIQQFCMSQGIQHLIIAPYNASSNGEVERFVQTFKLVIDKVNPSTITELQDSVVNFLAHYQSTPHSISNQSSSEILNGRKICIRLDLLHLCQLQLLKSVLYHDVHIKPKQFLVGESVWIRNLRPGKRWLLGTIKERKGNVMYKVTVEGSTVLWRCHANQSRVRKL